MNCRHCGKPLIHNFIDLGFAPPSNAYLKLEDLSSPEIYLPLKVKVCDQCWLVQTEDHTKANLLFNADYAYFSSTSSNWLAHAACYAESMIKQLSLSSDSFVIESASNDGYLLKNFVTAGIPCLGIEPTESTALAAEKLGVPVLREFFGESLGRKLATQGRQADLIAGNNVLAHVPDINDFTLGLKASLKPGGTITLEFPHLMQLLEHTQFDTLYHEHFSYLSLYTVRRIFQEAGLRLWHVEQLATHGGSLRVFACHADDTRSETSALGDLIAEETLLGMLSMTAYSNFQSRAEAIKNDLLCFLIEQKRAGKKVAAYGAAAKGNTLLNFAGIKLDLLAYVCDAAASKIGKFMPGSHIPILPPQALRDGRPDFVLILPWNIADEIRQQHAYIHDWGGKFVVASPSLKISG